MTFTIDEFNKAEISKIEEGLTRCCGSSRWVTRMVAERPFKSLEDIQQKATNIWHTLEKNDWLEAFQHHPQIGDLGSLKKKFAGAAAWAQSEQQSTSDANEDTLMDLAANNQAYFKKFGYIFIICATGRTAQDMLDNLKLRILNDPQDEISIAAGEQKKITALRLKKLIV